MRLDYRKTRKLLSARSYALAYRYGWESKARHGDRSFDAAEADLERGWAKSSTFGWSKAREPARDAWEHANIGRLP